MKQSGLKKLGFLAITSGIAFSSNAAVVINEIDYDQPGTDTAEFIELFNSGESDASLQNYSIDLINGSNSTSYRNIDLSGFSISASGYFVICGDASLVANCDYSFTTTSGWMQNGAPDAVALYDNGSLMDSVSYEGEIQPYQEGSILAFADSNTDIASLSRIPDGVDGDDNGLDFQSGCITPGTANIAGIGDCSATQVSAVPVPAAAWLFASGILGLTGLARRK